jgi:hypothetical protein
MMRSQPREVVVNYGRTPDLGSTVTKRCAVRCTVSSPAQTDEVIYVRLVYRDAAGHQIASAAVRPVALQ